jgi:hypothetical protein
MDIKEIKELTKLRVKLFGKNKFVEFSEKEKESKDFKRYNILIKKRMQELTAY